MLALLYPGIHERDPMGARERGKSFDWVAMDDLTDAFACQYFPRVRRYYDALSHRPDLERTCHDGQLDLFEDADVPF